MGIIKTIQKKYIQIGLALACLVVVVLNENCSSSMTSNSSPTGHQAGPSPSPSPSQSMTPSTVSIALNQALPALTNATTLAGGFTVTDSQSLALKAVTCQLDANMATDCSSLTYSYMNLTDGDHKLTINATDVAGSSATPLISVFRIDSTPPTLVLNLKPNAVTGLTSAEFTFTANDNLSGVAYVDCALDAAAYANCQSPLMLSNLSLGNHTLNLKAFDNAGNVSTVSSYSWTIDTAAPSLTLSQKPSSLTNQSTANFAFSATDNGQTLSVFTCSLDGATYTSCTSPMSYTNLSAGTHTFGFEAQNIAGQMSTPSTFTWTIDTQPPSAPTVTSNISSPTQSTSAIFSFSSTDTVAISSYKCAVDSATPTICMSPLTVSNLKDGAHTIQITASNAAGNTSSPANYAWVVDTTPPAITINAPPNTASGSITFSIVETGSGIKSITCAVDVNINNPVELANNPGLQNITNCTSPIAFNNFYATPHSITITATDKAGNQQTQTLKWTLTLSLSQQIQAAQTTATSSSWCVGANNDIRPFYWEIGDASGISSTGSLQAGGPVPAPTPSPSPSTVTRTTIMSIASASKFIFGTYVLQSMGNTAMDQVTSDFLHMAAGYTWYQDSSCTNLSPITNPNGATLVTVTDGYNSCCVVDKNNAIVLDSNGKNMCGTGINHSTPISSSWIGAKAITCNYDWTPAAKGVFSYGGGHFQRFAVAQTPGTNLPYPTGDTYGSTYGINIGALIGDLNAPNNPPNLAYTVVNTLGLASLYGRFQYGFPQMAGGIATDAATYATILQNIIKPNGLAMYNYLGKDPMCAWTATKTFGACNAYYSPINEAPFHYSYSHWVEDAPLVAGAATAGDGTFSSPGKFGFYPWIDATKTYYGIVARQAQTGSNTGSGSTVGSGWNSLLCGRQIRAAFFTGVVQP